MGKASILLLALLLVAGCGPGAIGSAADDDGAESGSGGSSESTATSQTAPSGSDVVAVWTRSGGLAGRTEVMTVYADGWVTLDQQGGLKTALGDMGTINALQQTFAGSEWQALDSSYGEQFPDAFQYTIEAGGKTVQTYDGAENPALLDTVQQQLGELYQAASSTG